MRYKRSSALFAQAKQVIPEGSIPLFVHSRRLVAHRSLFKKQKGHIYLMKMAINTLILYPRGGH